MEATKFRPIVLQAVPEAFCLASSSSSCFTMRTNWATPWKHQVQTHENCLGNTKHITGSKPRKAAEQHYVHIRFQIFQTSRETHCTHQVQNHQNQPGHTKHTSRSKTACSSSPCKILFVGVRRKDYREHLMPTENEEKQIVSKQYIRELSAHSFCRAAAAATANI
jgi:hypothetical protein